MSGEHILWVGPGSRPQPLWRAIMDSLILSGGLQIDRIHYLDYLHRPRPLYPARIARDQGFVQTTARGDFFAEASGWDIVILDYINAWPVGAQKLATPPSTAPHEAIHARWSARLAELDPFQVWVLHDFMPTSTVIPDLSATHAHVVESTRRGEHLFGLDVHLRADDAAWYWLGEIAWLATRGSGFDVWQRPRSHLLPPTRSRRS